MDTIIEESYDPHYGARPLRRYLQREIETNVGRMILASQIKENSIITIDGKDGKLVYGSSEQTE